VQQKRLLLALLLSTAVLVTWSYLYPTAGPQPQVQQPPGIAQTGPPGPLSTTVQSIGSWHGWRTIGRVTLGLIIGVLLLIGFLVFCIAVTAAHEWKRLILIALVCCLLAFLVYVVKGIIHYFNSPVGIATIHTTLRFAPLTAFSCAVCSILLNGLRSVGTGKGYSTDPHAEWRYVNRDGSVGGRYGAATVRDVYEHRHGSGSWQRKEENFLTFVSVLRVGTFVLAIVMPFFGANWFVPGHVSKVIVILALATLSLVISLAVSQCRTWIGLLILSATIGLVWLTH